MAQPVYDLFFFFKNGREVLRYLLLSPVESDKLYRTFVSYVSFLIIHSMNSISVSSFQKTFPFLIAKSFQSVLGDVNSIKKLQFGDLLVKVSSVSQSELLSNRKEMGSFSISVQIYSTLNTSRGVISEPDFFILFKRTPGKFKRPKKV